MAMTEVASFYFAKYLEDGTREKVVGQDENGEDIVIVVPKDEQTGPGQLYPGEFFEGSVVEYNADSGGKDYNEKVCGLASIMTESGDLIKVTLDKGRLKTAFANLALSYNSRRGSFIGAFVRVQYDGWQEPVNAGSREYKGFTVRHDDEKFSAMDAAVNNLNEIL